MKKLTFGIIGLIVILLLSTACSSAPAPRPETVPGTTSTGKAVPPLPPGVPAPTITIPPQTAVPRPTPAPAPSGAGSPVYSSDASTVDRMIVRTGQMILLVEDVPGTIGRIVALAEGRKGYVVSSNSWREAERLRGTISIRVPAPDFESVMSAVAALAIEVTQQTTSSKDVTEEYTDLTSRLKNLEATEQQLLRIMEKATKIEDVLAIQRELTNTRNQIEQAKGRMQLLERTSAMSLININVEQAKLEVKFNAAGGRVVQVEEAVKFVSQIVGGFYPYSYQWSFGDGDTSTELTPTHAYRTAGSYTVSLKITDNRGNTATETTKDYISVIAAPGWSAGNVARSAWNALVGFSKVLANVLIWLGIFSPVWIIGGGIGYLMWRRRKKASRA